MAWYSAGLERFIHDDPAAVVEQLQREHSRHFERLSAEQHLSWEESVRRLQETLRAIDARLARPLHVILEYPLQRMARRIDCVLLVGGTVVAAEFKRGASASAAAAASQAEDYAFSLNHFHDASHGRIVLPVAVGDFTKRECRGQVAAGRAAVLRWDGLGDHVLGVARGDRGEPIEPGQWIGAGYRSTVTIIESARELFNNHSVSGLNLTGADEAGLEETTRAVLGQVREAKATGSHRVVFVTGVPGAGKTLVGLSVVQRARGSEGVVQDDQAVMMSGNGPLVRILREALIRDARQRRKARGERAAVDRVTRKSIEAFIQEMHRFTAQHSGAGSVPVEHVLVFDEAQRAWNREKCAEYITQRNRRLARATGTGPATAGAPGLSEPETILEILGRKDWAVLVCLVGPGQEIYRGEGGLATWGEALRRFPAWKVYGAPELRRDHPDGRWPDVLLRENEGLHLAVNRRCQTSENVTRWVEFMLECKPEAASRLAASIPSFPFELCRGPDTLRRALRSHQTGYLRAGVLASSGAARLRPSGFEPPAFAFTQNVVDPVEWFLREPGDILSSNQLEVAMSEFESQGLELDLTGVCWGGDLCFDSARRSWGAWRFSGGEWKKVPLHQEGKRKGEAKFILNKYRVLLTRFRHRCVIMVPRGNPEDPTQLGPEMDAVAGYLLECGVKAVD